MFAILKDILSPERRRKKRALRRMFGPYVSLTPVRQKIRMIVFFSPDWGFTDSSLPKLKELLESIGSCQLSVDHNSARIHLIGEDEAGEFNRVRLLIEHAATQPDFEGFKVGVAEGYAENGLDMNHIACEAYKNGREA